jgi:hypothetical protein
MSSVLNVIPVVLFGLGCLLFLAYFLFLAGVALAIQRGPNERQRHLLRQLGYRSARPGVWR